MTESKEFRAKRIDSISIRSICEENIKIEDIPVTKRIIIFSDGKVEVALQHAVLASVVDKLDVIDFIRIQDSIINKRISCQDAIDLFYNEFLERYLK